MIIRSLEGKLFMGVTNSNKELNVSEIACGGSFQMKLSLTAAPDITTNPTDIVLILDRSAGMQGTPLQSLKTARRLSLISLTRQPMV